MAYVDSITFFCDTLDKDVTATQFYFYANSCFGNHYQDEYCYCDTSKYVEATCECEKNGRNLVHTLSLD